MVEDAYVACRKRPITDLPPWKRWLARFTYRRTSWAPCPQIEFIGIFTSKDDAVEAARVPGGFWHCLPVNTGLPDVPMQYKGHGFPLSDKEELREPQSCEVLGVRRCDIEDVIRLAGEVKAGSARLLNPT